jgi:hypothetical protein|tara:strand:- start:749 stop:973 length:225 start_codon:yes stop_codon:yes gene_type:complete
MSLINKLEVGGSPLSVGNGATPSIPNFAGSTLHDTYSINNIPIMPTMPAPSQLDLNGAVPDYNYRDNAPEGTSF